MRATGWNNGAWRKNGVGYGIKIEKADRNHFFQKAWSDVRIELPSGVTTTVSISNSFWKKCAELRSQDIGHWMIGVGFAPWKTGTPPV